MKRLLRLLSGADATPPSPKGSSKDDSPSTSLARRQLTKTQQSWVRAQSVLKAVHFTSALHTLRDTARATRIDYNADLLHLRVVGEGAFGVVEQCHYLPQGRHVAVKRLKLDDRLSRDQIADILREAALMRKLRSQYIVEYIGSGAFTDAQGHTVHFLVTEYVDGGTLKAMVKQCMVQGKRLYTMQDALRWSIDIARGLQYLHESIPKVIHRDMKLDNVLLQGTNPHTARAKICDMGLSALVRPNHIPVPVLEQELLQQLGTAYSPAPPRVTIAANATSTAQQQQQQQQQQQYQAASVSFASGTSSGDDASEGRGSHGGTCGGGGGGVGGGVIVASRVSRGSRRLSLANIQEHVVLTQQELREDIDHLLTEGLVSEGLLTEGLLTEPLASKGADQEEDREDAALMLQLERGDHPLKAWFSPLSPAHTCHSFEGHLSHIAPFSPVASASQVQHAAVHAASGAQAGTGVQAAGAAQAAGASHGGAGRQAAAGPQPVAESLDEGEAPQPAPAPQAAVEVHSAMGAQLAGAPKPAEAQAVPGQAAAGSAGAQTAPLLDSAAGIWPAGPRPAGSLPEELTPQPHAGSHAAPADGSFQVHASPGPAELSPATTADKAIPYGSASNPNHAAATNDGSGRSREAAAPAPGYSGQGTADTSYASPQTAGLGKGHELYGRKGPAVQYSAVQGELYGRKGQAAQYDEVAQGARAVKAVQAAAARRSSGAVSWAALSQQWSQRARAHSGRPGASLRIHPEGNKLGGRVGTWFYMAPEIYRQETYDEKADVFSFGMIVYELVHRFRLSMIVNSPAEAQGFARQMACTSYRPPLDMQLPSEIIDIITRCWDASPKARPSMAEVVKMLQVARTSPNWQKFDKVERDRYSGLCGCFSFS